MLRARLIGLVFGIAGLAATCETVAPQNDFQTYVFEGDVSFSVEYPADWTVSRSRNVVHFIEQENEPRVMELVVYDPSVTPPLAVYITYDTLRVVESPHGPIPVMARDPSAVTERYVAFIRFDSHVAEFRSYSEREYDAVFDHMLVTTNRINSR
jgi:hypothetical protein